MMAVPSGSPLEMAAFSSPPSPHDGNIAIVSR
jgi:hypothetical protein